MKLNRIPQRGFFEEQGEVSEELNVVKPENDLEEAELAWSLMRHPETVSDDSARRDYVFNYQVKDHLGDGVYRLVIDARDASGGEWSVEIAAALVVSPPATGERAHGFTPFWFISKSMHFDSDDPQIKEHYPGEAFGSLDMARVEALPHRRLFGVSAGTRA